MDHNAGARAPNRFSSMALYGLLLSVAAVIAVLVAGLGYRLDWWHFTTGLEVAQWAVYGAAIGLALSLAGAVRANRRSKTGRRGFVPGVLGVAFALPILVMAVQWEYAARAYPPINDITTDTENPPVFWDMPNPMDYPGAKTAALQRSAYPELAPLELAIAPGMAFEHALAVARDKGWDIVATEPGEGRLEFTVRSFLFGFTDEVAVRVSASDKGARVDVRSRSRLGRIDRGTNAKRIRDYLAALDERAGQKRQ